jgi:hypothetical protein
MVLLNIFPGHPEASLPLLFVKTREKCSLHILPSVHLVLVMGGAKPYPWSDEIEGAYILATTSMKSASRYAKLWRAV